MTDALIDLDHERAARSADWEDVSCTSPEISLVVRLRNGSETKPGRYFRRDDGQFYSLDDEGRVEAHATHWQAA